LGVWLSKIVIYGVFQLLLERKTVDDVDKDRSITKDSRGFLHFAFYNLPFDANSSAKSVIDFRQFLKTPLAPRRKSDRILRTFFCPHFLSTYQSPKQ
jgi:hypothetical protein